MNTAQEIAQQITQKILELNFVLKFTKEPFRSPAIVRFARSFEVDENNCWCWKNSLNNVGYGNFSGTSSHRFVYEYVFDAIPPDLQLDHLCRNRNCCNPNHLEVVTAVENVLRGRRHCANCRQNKCSNH